LHIKDKILIEVATSDWLYKASKTVSPYHFDDLAQHILLVLCEMSEEKLLKIYNEGYLKLFCIKVMWKQSTSPRQQFFKQMQSCGLFDVDSFEIEFLDTLEEKIEQEEQLQRIEKIVGQNRWYEREIFRLWSSGESARSIHRQTKISLREVLNVIKTIKRQINESN